MTSLVESIEVLLGVLSRDLKLSQNGMYPEEFADRAWEWAKQYDNVEVTIINYDQALKAGMGGLVAVGKDSPVSLVWSSLK